MAIFSRGITFGATETVTNTKLHNLIDNATITNIVNADIAAGAAIEFSKIAQGEVDGSLLVNLNNIVVGANKIPFANLNVPFGSTYVSLVSIPNQSLLPLTQASWVSALSFRDLASIPTNQQVPYNLLVNSIGSGSIPVYDGLNNFIAKALSEMLTLNTQDYTATIGNNIEATLGSSSTNDNSPVKLRESSPFWRSGKLRITVPYGGGSGNHTISFRSNDTTVLACAIFPSPTATAIFSLVSIIMGEKISLWANKAQGDVGIYGIVTFHCDNPTQVKQEF